jgi:hypothetical protein
MPKFPGGDASLTPRNFNHSGSHNSERYTLHFKRLYWLIALALSVFFSVAAHAQVSFVQITDPHIFDDVDPSEGSLLEDKAALASCVEKINRMASERSANSNTWGSGTYDFVIVTGDLGIEQLLKGVDETERKNKIAAGAIELASLIGLSRVQTWLFVPGDNDLLDEKPENIHYYHKFIAALREAAGRMENKINIIDLCAKEDSASGDKSDPWPTAKPYRIGKYAFIGFDNASFKNTGDDPGATANDGASAAVPINKKSDVQKDYAAQVNRQLAAPDIEYAYIFYHIPEIDDPYLVTLKEQEEPVKIRYANRAWIGGSYMHSAWFVRADVREEWNKAVIETKVKGLFAGHFHDYKRDTYQSFKWLRTPDYLSDSLKKLHLCPPLALKNQKDKGEQARGFQEVNITNDGEVSTRIYWFEQAGWNLSAGAAALEEAALRQLELGRTYEGLDRFKEAEAAYAKAAESNWTPTRQSALSSLRRVSERQDSFLVKNVASPAATAWAASLTAFGTAFFTAVLTIVTVFVLWWLWKWAKSRLLINYLRQRGADKLKLGPIEDSPKGSAGPRFEKVAAMVNRRMQTHFKSRKVMRGVPRLPMVAESQAAEVAALIESVVPGGAGKFVSWLLKQIDMPQYSIEGVIQTDGHHQLFFVSLNEEGTTLKTWHESSVGRGILANEKKLAFAALKHLVRHMNK